MNMYPILTDLLQKHGIRADVDNTGHGAIINIPDYDFMTKAFVDVEGGMLLVYLPLSYNVGEDCAQLWGKTSFELNDPQAFDKFLEFMKKHAPESMRRTWGQHVGSPC